MWANLVRFSAVIFPIFLSVNQANLVRSSAVIFPIFVSVNAAQVTCWYAASCDYSRTEPEVTQPWDPGLVSRETLATFLGLLCYCYLLRLKENFRNRFVVSELFSSFHLTTIPIMKPEIAPRLKAYNSVGQDARSPSQLHMYNKIPIQK